MTVSAEMGLLKESLATWLASPPLWGGGPQLREPTRTIKAARQVEKIFAVDKPITPEPFDLVPIHARVAEAWQGSSLEGLSRRDRRSIPWILFFPDGREEEWLGRDRDFVKNFLKLDDASPSRRTIASLLKVFLQSARPDDFTYETLRLWLRRQVFDGASVGLALWRERCQKYGLLEKDNARALRQAVAKSGLAVGGALAEAGLAPGLERSELVRRAVEELLKETGDTLTASALAAAELNRVLPWLELEGRLRFDDLRLATTQGLLAPFVDRRPPADIGDLLRTLFVRCLGDPRFRNADGWFGVPEAQKLVVLRLLVELTLDDFFTLLDKTALDEHWRYRKKFWKAYVDKGVVDDARVVLGPNAKRLAPRYLDNSTVLSSAALSGGGVLRDHSVLLLRIGRLVVAEWSHNGKCRVWFDHNSSAPSLWQSSYEGTELNNWANPDHEFAHLHSQTGSWQGRAADWIWRHSRILAQPQEYMP